MITSGYYPSAIPGETSIGSIAYSHEEVTPEQVAPPMTLALSARRLAQQTFLDNQNNFDNSRAQLSNGDTSSGHITAYIKNMIQLLKTQFESLRLPECMLLTPGTWKNWSDLCLSLSCESSPWLLQSMGVSGANPMCYAIALDTFLDSSHFENFCELNQTNPMFSVIEQSISRLKIMLGPYLKTLVAINALKIVPQGNDPQKLIKLLNCWLTESVDLNQQTEILYPVGWELPNSGHFFLSKLHSMTAAEGGGIKIDIFDAAKKPKEKYIGIYAQQSATSYSFTKNTTLPEQLQSLYEIVPLMIPQSGYLDLSNSDTTPTQMTRRCAEVAYRAMSTGAQKIEIAHASPLQYTEYMQSKNCVISSFRMFLYTLVRECAEQSAADLACELELKSLCQAFFDVFKMYVAKQMKYIPDLT